MSAQRSLTGRLERSKWIPHSPITSSFQAGWENVQLDYFCLPALSCPEISSSQHIILIPLGHPPLDFELVAAGHSHTVTYRKKDCASGCIELYPANLPISLQTHPTVKPIELIQCYLEPTFLTQVAHESVHPGRIELMLTLKKPDPLIAQIGLALKSCLESDPAGNRFYADSIATALATHLLRHYSIRNPNFLDYTDGLSQQKLKQAIAYIQTHLNDNLSLSEVANQVGMSQYYFCRLFKRSTGLSPYQYLIQQRIERAKHLLTKSEQTITAIALDCGFANQSHFSRYFHQHTGMNPKQFRQFNSS